ncbi:MAG TPA: DMT family transporter [Acidimicrobiia bacterium]
MRRVRPGYAIGLTAALLFGASAPVSKVLLEDAGPQMLAGLLYLGAFLAVAPFVRLGPERSEARLRRSDVPLLAGVVVTGGIAAPVLLMLGLERLTGVSGSLLLNLEGPLTLLVGVVVLHEYLGRRAMLGSLVIFGGSALIGLQGGGGNLDVVGAVLVVTACLGWAVDNNLTQRLSVRDPFQIVAVKTGVAAVVNVTLALARGEALPSSGVILGALALGAVAYGVSIVLDAYALRMLGAAREAAAFATAPFAGALLAVPLLAETWSAADVAAAAAMALGVVVLVGDLHEHEHVHEPLTHDHRHVHDEHHQHEHLPGIDPTEPHSHPHEHGRLMHAHAHVSDAHHRHRHRHR